MNKIFNLKGFLKEALLKEGGPKRIKDRGILWREKYHDRSAGVKKRLTRELGEGSYYRWEGHDYTTNSDYFVVVGPAVEKNGRKSFFAGIKKLPPIYKRKKVYAPYGKYFSTIVGALSHASKMWGIRFPQGQKNYMSEDLQDVKISRHVKG